MAKGSRMNVAPHAVPTRRRASGTPTDATAPTSTDGALLAMGLATIACAWNAGPRWGQRSDGNLTVAATLTPRCHRGLTMRVDGLPQCAHEPALDCFCTVLLSCPFTSVHVLVATCIHPRTTGTFSNNRPSTDIDTYPDAHVGFNKPRRAIS